MVRVLAHQLPTNVAQVWFLPLCSEWKNILCSFLHSFLHIPSISTCRFRSYMQAAMVAMVRNNCRLSMRGCCSIDLFILGQAWNFVGISLLKKTSLPLPAERISCLQIIHSDDFQTLYFSLVHKKYWCEQRFCPQTLFAYCIFISNPLSI